jgi:hypothetical protein
MSYCINYDCYPSEFAGKTLALSTEPLLVSEAPNKTATLVTYLVPDCVGPSVRSYKYDDNGDLALLPDLPGENGVFQYPEKGIAAMSFEASVEPLCNDRYVAALVTSTFVQDDQPRVPTSSCPCWVTPQEAVDPNPLGCDGIKIPVTLETIPNWRTNYGVSYRQCIDPANFDFL